VIPRVLHRIWLDDPLPDEFAGYGRRLAQLHPGWELQEWRSTADLPLPSLRNWALFDQGREVCPRDWKRFRSDLLRLELLWLYGGIYVDCDVEPLRPFDPLLDHQAFVVWSPNRGPGGQRLLTQAVIGATPGHPFIGACLDAVAGSVRDHAGKPLAQMVGPWMVHRVWESSGWPDVAALPERTFGPQSNRDRNRGLPVDLDGAFGWHRWANTRDRRRGGVG
jgi:mannosyltransferase OCH1-like enzyme